jgi:hypothetical protein
MTTWKLSQAVKGLRPLAALDDGLIFYRRGSLYKVGYNLQRPKFLCRLPVRGLSGHLANRIRLVDRIFRIAPSHAIVIDNHLLVAQRSEIFCCDLRTGLLSLDFRIPEGRRSLGFCQIIQPNGEQEVMFGEYFANLERSPVRIWGRALGEAEWKQRAVFDQGEIEHVHALSFIDGKVFVLSGDFGTAAGIWVADTTFSDLRPLARGKQAYRAAWMEALAGQVYIATDTQLEPNHVYTLRPVDDSLSLKKLAPIGGSSIYAGRGPTEIFFSTTVECGAPSGNFIRDILDTRAGPGMLSRNSSLFTIDEQGGVSEVYAAQKDAWPFRLAQFGTFMFPSGIMPADTLIAYGVALKGVDDTCLVFRRS